MSHAPILSARKKITIGHSSATKPAFVPWLVVWSAIAIVITFLALALLRLRPTISDDMAQTGITANGNIRKSLPLPLPLPTVSLDDHIASLRYMGHKATNTGWYVDTLCLRDKPNLVVYGVGAGEDISWDIGMRDEYGASVVIIDPTEKAKRHVESVLLTNPNKNDKIKFLPQGLSNKDGEIIFALPENPNHVSMRSVDLKTDGTEKTVSAPVRTLQSFMNELGHDYLDVLKIDIEGSEYDVLETLMEQDFMPFTQLLVEYHDRFLKGKAKMRHQQLLKKLKQAGFVQLWSQNHGQERGYIKEKDLSYCVDGISPRSPSIQ